MLFGIDEMKCVAILILALMTMIFLFGTIISLQLVSIYRVIVKFGKLYTAINSKKL